MRWERAVPLQRDDLLNPIPGNNPCGENLRYDPVYDRIKEARQEDEDDAPQGEWQRARKKADFALVIKLTCDALIKRSKDLQLAAWLGEALLRRESFPVLPDCISFLKDLQEKFWESCYPEIEDGSPELRCSPQEFFASRCDYILRRLPLTKNGLTWIDYQTKKTVPSEDDAKSDEKKNETREEAIKDGKLTPEDWNEALAATPKEFYEQIVQSLDASLDAVATLDRFCDEKYGSEGPSLGKLRSVLDEVRTTANVLYTEKGGPDSEQPAEEVVEGGGDDSSAVSVGGGAAAAPARVRAAGSWSEPDSPETAATLAARIAEYLRRQDPSLVAPYLLTRALRWGELRGQGDTLDESFLASPPTETRQQLRTLQREGNWEGLLNGVESAMATPSGRAWLDLQRYAWEACYNLSYSAVQKTICSETRALLQDYPDLVSMNLSDGTAVADRQTAEWIQENVVPRQAQPEQTAPVPEYAEARKEPSSENGHADYFEVAMQLAKSGHVAEAIDGFAREAARESSGRERFRRQLQMAQICLATQHFTLAYPILQALSQEIERRNLLDWEDPAFLAQVLAMLVQCIDRTTRDQQERARAYSLLCRLGPVAALQFERS